MKVTTAFKIDAKILAYAPWGGGKRRLAKRIVELLGEHDTYVEPFVGGCAILPRKPKANFEYLNDANPALVNVLLCVRDYPNSIRAALDDTPFDRESFEVAVEYVGGRTPGSERVGARAAAAQLVVWWMGANGYAGTTKTGWFAQRHTKMGGSPSVRWESFKRSLPALSERLRDVQIFCGDFREMIGKNTADLVGTAYYCDPPYFAKKFAYAHDFTAQDHADLAERLNQFRRARVVVSYYDAPELATLYPPDRWERHEVNVSKSSANARTGATKTAVTELLLVNRT